MVFIRISILFILALFVANLLIFNTVKAADAKITPSSVPNISVSVDKERAVVSDPNAVQIKDVYEILLKTKDDKILLLSNIINWILGIGAILIVVISSFFGYLLRRIRIQSKAAGEIISDLQGKEAEISDIQSKINTVLESTNFHDKMIEMDANMKRVNDLTSRWEKEEAERNIQEDLRIKKQALSKAKELLYRMEFNNIKSRMTDEEDIKAYESSKTFVEEHESGIDETTPAINYRVTHAILNVLIRKYFDLAIDHMV